MPRRGAPQPQGPGSGEACFADDPDTAKTESSRATLWLSQFLQVTWLESKLVIFSNLLPQSRHSNSKMGIAHLALWPLRRFQYSEVRDGYQAFQPEYTLANI
jgi:hypothetical protein